MTCTSLLLSKVMLFGLGNCYVVSAFSFFLFFFFFVLVTSMGKCALRDKRA